MHHYHAHEVWVQHLQQQLDEHWLILLHQLITLVTQKSWGSIQDCQRRGAQLSAGPHLSPHRVGQEAAYSPHSLLNLGFCRVFLQDAVDVCHRGLTNLAVPADLKARLLQCS